MHIYAFGSVCRGDITFGSDIDLLAIVNGHDPRFSPQDYSIYSYSRMTELWGEGNPFAWHLSLEAKLLHSSDDSDFFWALGRPGAYANCLHDCEKFRALFREARTSFETAVESRVFDLSMAFLALRNFATCFSLGVLDKPDFSRNSARRLGSRSVPITTEAYTILERARVLCTRAVGESISEQDAKMASTEFQQIDLWMDKLLKEVRTSCNTNLITA